MRSKKAIINTITNLLSQIITIVVGFIIPRIMISHFGSEVNGLLSSINQFLGYITLLESGFGPVVKATLYKPIANKNKKEIEEILKSSEKFFRNIAKIFIVYIIALCFLFPLLVKSNFSYIYTVSLIIILSLSTFAEYYFGMTYRLYLQAEQKTYIITVIQIITYVLNALLIIVFVKLNMSIHLVKLLSALIFILRPLLQNLYIKKKYKINLKQANSEYKIKQKWDGLAQHIAFVIHKNTDVTVLSIFGNLTLVSIYTVYNMVVSGINNIITSFSSGITSGFGDMIAKGEKENLNSRFKMYEAFYFSIAAVLYTSTIILIVPFVEIYTKGITDANYVQKLFGYLLVISELIWAIRLPYSSLVLAAGHFKQTMRGAWIESISNIIISVALVNVFGIVGVAIGTIVSMLIRTIEYIYHANKYILERHLLANLKNIIILCVEIVLIYIIVKYVPMVENTSYINWIINSVIVFIISTIIIFALNAIIFKNEFKKLIYIIKETVLKRSQAGEK